MDYSELLVIIGSAVLTAFIAHMMMARPTRVTGSDPMASDEPLSLLFDDGVLHHANPAALNKFVLFPGTHVWDDLRQNLVARFPDFPLTAGTGPVGSVKIQSRKPKDSSVIELNWRDSLCWVEVRDETTSTQRTLIDTTDSAAMARNAATSRQPAWETDGDGDLMWNNAAYTRLLEEFDLSDASSLANAVSDTDVPRRIMLENRNGDTEWLEVVATPHAQGKSFEATCITPLTKAEEAQRSFVQTLAKTFAHLPIGLAIFDDRGHLSIFNPALVDLTGLQASFLATQPTMITFFDDLRESRRMPEPKNYRTWRQDIAEMIAAASGGQYRETWTLEDGRTYAVQGRPHPDGATAFLIEDISAEVTLSRSFKAEVLKFEMMLDNVTDALVVFSMTGVLTFCNAAYRDMFRQNPEAAFADVTFSDAVRLWNERIGADGDWTKLSKFIAASGSRGTQHMDVPMTSEGATLHCDMSALAGQGSLVRFSITQGQSKHGKQGLLKNQM